jgi:hypothetical protein
MVPRLILSNKNKFSLPIIKEKPAIIIAAKRLIILAL